MAHYKRKRPRTAAGSGYSANAYKHRRGPAYTGWEWLGNWPRAWDKVFHTRPTRRRAKAQIHAIIRGADAEDMTWPCGRKPHNYYW